MTIKTKVMTSKKNKTKQNKMDIAALRNGRITKNKSLLCHRRNKQLMFLLLV